jgi:UDP-N-acetylglucosamine 1-carboxyvinyltransferase
LTQANGQSSIYEKLFENRLGYLKELVRMGAKVDFVDNHHAVIYGPTKLYGQRIESLDLRAGATLLIAGLIASGTTEIKNAENIDRGYERIESRLEKIGAKIKRIQ